ncbi:glycine cleavage system aminomethyltransferase GcvT [Fodinicurvata halophila]|uniref:aminomethyltransferase n=2 Tax=Fodinicurvata halophila TaxID=1419723 RepID=A0ABV8UNT9_9PROT
MTDNKDTLATTPLHALHVELGGRMVPFAGYDMPVQYPDGIMSEHLHCRSAAGLFDVSHMGQVRVKGKDVRQAVETLLPADLVNSEAGRMHYSFLLNDKGGILDDLMVTPFEDHVFMVLNAACKQSDIAHLKARLPAGCEVIEEDDKALLALQGPEAANVLSALAPDVAEMRFMTMRDLDIAGVPCRISRSGYTGEDGYEISVPGAQADAFARKLLADARVKPIGLGARDSLRLEAGLCLYGHDIDETTTPIEAALTWAVAKSRREAGGFPGDSIILKQIAEKTPQRRVGLIGEGRAPVREGAELVNDAGEVIGKVTSGSYGPSAEAPVAMGYLPRELSEPGTKVKALVRGRERPMTVAKMPFVEHRYYRG